jgi:hypothetical protein
MLYHKRLIEKKNDEDIFDKKIIGYFSCKEKAEKIKLEYKNLPGFRDYPNDFIIDEYEMDKDYYAE